MRIEPFVRQWRPVPILTGALLIVLGAAHATAEVRTITATGEYRMGDNDTRTDAKRLALLDAKRLALEQAGTYLESVTEVKNLQVSHDELRAYTAGIVEVTEQATKDVMEGAMHIVRVEVTAQVDTAVIARQITTLQNNELVRNELLRIKNELDLLRQTLASKTRELASLKSNDERRVAERYRQDVLAKTEATVLLLRAEALLAGTQETFFLVGASTIEGLYCSPLRQRPAELSKLWLIHQGGISHEATEVGRENQNHHRARRPQGQIRHGHL